MTNFFRPKLQDGKSVILNNPKTIFRYANEQVDKIPFAAIEKIANVTNTDLKWLIGWDSDEVCEDKTLIKKLYSLVKTMSDNDIEKIIEYAIFINSKKL